MINLDLTVPDAVLAATQALRRDPFYIVRPQTETVSGITTPTDPERLGPYDGEFWEVSGDELAPQVAEARGRYRLATALELPSGVKIAESDQVEIGGRVYDVAWAPEPSGLDLTRVVGLKD